MFTPIFIPIDYDDENYLPVKASIIAIVIAVLVSIIIGVGVCYGPEIVHSIRYSHGKVIASGTVTDSSGEHSITFDLIEK